MLAENAASRGKLKGKRENAPALGESQSGEKFKLLECHVDGLRTSEKVKNGTAYKVVLPAERCPGRKCSNAQLLRALLNQSLAQQGLSESGISFEFKMRQARNFKWDFALAWQPGVLNEALFEIKNYTAQKRTRIKHSREIAQDCTRLNGWVRATVLDTSQFPKHQKCSQTLVFGDVELDKKTVAANKPKGKSRLNIYCDIGGLPISLKASHV